MTDPKQTLRTSRKKLAVIDGKSVFYRGYYAMPGLATKDGQPTGGVFGFATMALEVIRKLQPDYVAVAWDKPKTNIRRRLELYPEYKAGRKPAPPDFKAQIPILHELLAAFGWPLYEMDDYEADDLMGALAVQAAAQDLDTMLITSDLDMLQLVNDRVHVYALKKGLSNIELYSPETFEAKYGIRVDQFLDLKSLKGDSSDNIPGVPGIGEKGAVQLLQQYDTLDGVYENLPLLKATMAKKLIAGKELAYLSRELAAIWTDAPLPLDLAALDGSGCDPARLLELLHQLEFRNLAKQLPEVMQVKVSEHQAVHGGLTLQTGSNMIVDSEAKLKDVQLPAGKPVYIYSRAGGKHGNSPQVLVLSVVREAGRVSDHGHDVYTLDLTKLDAAHVAELTGSVSSLVGYDTKSTLQVLRGLGVDAGKLPTIGHDVLIGAFLLNSLRREQTLTELASADLNYEGSAFEELDPEELMSRAPEVIAVIKALHAQQTKDLAELPRLEALARDVEFPVIAVLANMEYEGMLLDTAYLKKFAEEIGDKISDYEQQIYGLAGQEFNVSSPTQLAEVLFTTQGLPTIGIKKGKTGYSTAASELDKLRGQHPIIDLITLYREVTKLKNTYVDTLPLMVDKNSRVHTTFALTVAQTGRLSSNDPNLQNIPTRTDLGRHIRTAFVAGKATDGTPLKLVSADYSQFELRLAAVMADDTELIEMFNRGADIHTATAALVYGREQEDVTKSMRRDAKVINFGILYGMSPHGLAIATGMDRLQATHFIDKYKAVRKPLFDYIDRTRALAHEQGYVETLLGRRRPTPDVRSGNFIVRQAAERAAINMPIQGTEADLMKLAMVKVDQLLAGLYPAARQLMQVHDSILVEAPESGAEAVGKLLKETMETIYKLPVRLDVDVSIGDNWGEL